MKLREFNNLLSRSEGAKYIYNKIMECEWFHNCPDTIISLEKENSLDIDEMMYVGRDRFTGVEIWLRPTN